MANFIFTIVTFIVFPISSSLLWASAAVLPWVWTALDAPYVLGALWSVVFVAPPWWPMFTLIAAWSYYGLGALAWWTPGLNATWWFQVFSGGLQPWWLGIRTLSWAATWFIRNIGEREAFLLVVWLWYLYTVVGFMWFSMLPYLVYGFFFNGAFVAPTVYLVVSVAWLMGEGMFAAGFGLLQDVWAGVADPRALPPMTVIALLMGAYPSMRSTLYRLIRVLKLAPFGRFLGRLYRLFLFNFIVRVIFFPLTFLPSIQEMQDLLLGIDVVPAAGRTRFLARVLFTYGFHLAQLRERGTLDWFAIYGPAWGYTPFLYVVGFWVHALNMPWSDEVRAFARTSVRTIPVRFGIFIAMLVIPEIYGFCWLVLQIAVGAVLLFIGHGLGYQVYSSVFEAAFGPLAASRNLVLRGVPQQFKMAYLWAVSWMPLNDEFVVRYDAGDHFAEWSVRLDLPTGFARQSLADALWLRRNRLNTEIISFSIFWAGVLTFVFWFPVALLTGLGSDALSYLSARIRRLWLALLVALAMPDKVCVCISAGLRWSWWQCWSALYTGEWPDVDVLWEYVPVEAFGKQAGALKASWVNFLNMLGLLVLFKIAPHPDEVVRAAYDRVQPQLRPEHRERRIDIIRRNVNRFWRTIDALALPEFIESVYQPPTVANVRETYAMLRDAGFPGLTTEFVDSIQAPKDDPYLAAWASPITGWSAVTSYAFGPMRMAARVFEEMANFGSIQVPGYVHTGTYNTAEAELASTSRYWSGSTAEEFSGQSFSDVVEDVWLAVRAQYEFSRLATFEYIYDRWVKKYNLGFGFEFVRRGASGKGRARPLKRSEAIRAVGGKQAFLRLWRFAYTNAGRMVHISTVFTKMETLKLKKALAGSVRTVLSSSFTHHAMTTVWNYLPNHNYKIWETPMKVGMRFAGEDFGNLWTKLSRHTFIWAGDMTAFDSSLPPVVVNVVREIRKKGFETHKDAARIGQLIDMAYEVLLKHPLGFKSSGMIVPKPSQGFTTGHSSTTPDNSIALVVCYMFAWRAITGLRAREFMHYNSLANFGDDHVLGWEPVFGWDPAKAASKLRELGIIMRDEAPGQVFMPGATVSQHEAYMKLWRSRNPGGDPSKGEAAFRESVAAEQFPASLKFSFLAKLPVPVAAVQHELDEFGVTYLHPFTTVHDRDRLLGKIKGQVSTKADPSRRHARLVSLMALTMHQPDVYEMLRVSLGSLHTTHADWFRAHPAREAIPPYSKVVRDWYAGRATQLPEEAGDESMDDTLEQVDMEAVTFFGHASMAENFVRWVADFPTVFSPRVVGNYWTDWFINKYPHMFSWVGALHVRANNLGPAVGEAKVRELISRTPYSFLRASGAFTPLPGPNVVAGSTLLLRHWLFMAYHLMWSRRPAISLLSLVSAFDKLFVNLQYILLGRQETVVVEVEVDLASHLVVALLSLIEWDIADLSAIWSYTVPTPSRLAAVAYDHVIKTLSPLGAVDVQPLRAAVQALGPGDSFLFSAPTGVGKSTRLVVTMHEASGARMVVILPRRLLVLSVTAYMRKSFPHVQFGAGTDGGFVPRDWAILYCTAQYALMADLPTTAIYMVDECHVSEPPHMTVMRRLLRLRRPTIFTSATPPDWLGLLVRNSLELPAQPRFKTVVVEKQARDYRSYLNEAMTFVSLARPGVKLLVFVKFVSDAVTFASNCGRRSCVLSSRHVDLDSLAEVYVSTSVSDAGLTIPDVSFVLSCDQDFTLTASSVFSDEEVRTVNVGGNHYQLSAAVLTQRRGRTGRTSDGTFVLWKLLGERAPLSISPEDYISSLGTLIPKVYQDLPAHVQRILPTQDELEQAGPLWITPLAPWIPPDQSAEQTPEVEHANVMASLLSQGRLFNPTGGQEYSYLDPSEIAPLDGEGFPVLIPRGSRLEVWYMADEDRANALFTQRTGGDDLSRQLHEFCEAADISHGALSVLLTGCLHPLSFASMLWIAPRTGNIWKLRHPHLGGPSVPAGLKRFFDRYVQANVGARITGTFTQVAIPAAPPVRVTPDLSEFIQQLAISRGVGTMTVLQNAVIVGVSYITFLEFLSQTPDALTLLRMPAATRPANYNATLIGLYNRWRR